MAHVFLLYGACQLVLAITAAREMTAPNPDGASSGLVIYPHRPILAMI
jgi:hypothetical protein